MAALVHDADAADVARANEPNLFCRQDTHPPARDSYPRNAFPWGRAADENISGYDVLLDFSGFPAGTRLVQQVQTGGPFGYCGQAQSDFGALTFEYFARDPAHDVRYLSVPAESRLDFTSRGMAAPLTMPAGAPAIEDGHEAAPLDDFVAALAEADRQRFLGAVQANVLLRTTIRWEYDGCNIPPDRTPRTTCRKTHCLTITLERRATAQDPYVEVARRSFDRDCPRE